MQHRSRFHSFVPTIGSSSWGPWLALLLVLGGPAVARSETKEAASASSAPQPAVQAPNPSGAAPAASAANGSEVSLHGLLSYADEHAPVLLVARSTRSRAEAARVASSVAALANPAGSVAVGPRVGASGTGVDVEAGLMQQIQVAGERGVRKRAASRLAELTEAEIEQLRWSVHCDVHAAFHRALVEQARADLAERVVVF